MSVKLTLAFFSTLTAVGINQAVAAPKQLYGKSVIVSWTEEREQRFPGEIEFHSRNFRGEFRVYISSTGNIFSRVTMTNPKGRSGSADKVGNNPGRNTVFQGNTMIGTQGGGSGGGARRIAVTFGPDFGSCSAQVIRGKAEGAAVITGKSIIVQGVTVEIRSVHATGVSCSVKTGNVFGSE